MVLFRFRLGGNCGNYSGQVSPRTQHLEAEEAEDSKEVSELVTAVAGCGVIELWLPSAWVSVPMQAEQGWTKPNLPNGHS
jgi:hypothetical protein